MYPAAFEYVRAESLEHALDVLADHGSDARPLAGGQSLRLRRPVWLAAGICQRAQEFKVKHFIILFNHSKIKRNSFS